MDTEDLDRYLNGLEHSHKVGVLALREAILAVDAGMSEHIKWNAPSFRFRCEDRVTMRLAPHDAFQLVLHRGSRVRDDTADFHFHDTTGLIRASPDRGVVDLTDSGVLDQRLAEVVDMVKRWVAS
ncbi:DUF1801 domain-containing protein [Jannaschia sp. R86511]|uniref:DUF1801 domain-containing protein n=1 Tax=Jannaschia sp. R86511 TaxID=3093853 RepID=UPI0036D3FB78